MIKKLALGLLCIVLIIIIGSCGSDSPKEPAAKAPAVTTTAKEPATKAPATTTTAKEPASTQQTIKWDKINEEAKTELLSKESFPYVRDIKFVVNQDQQEIQLIAIVDPSTKPATALDLADTMLRRYASWAKIYSKENFKPATKSYYGGLWDQYNAWVVVAPLGVSDPDDGFVNRYITKGMHTKQAPVLLKKYQSKN